MDTYGNEYSNGADTYGDPDIFYPLMAFGEEIECLIECDHLDISPDTICGGFGKIIQDPA